MQIQDFQAAIRPCRKVHGIAAALLPFEENGRIAHESFQCHLVRTHDAGLMNAVNMDTGYATDLDRETRSQVLKWTRQALGPAVPFVAGAHIGEGAGDVISLYRTAIDEIMGFDAIPIIFQTTRAHGLHWVEKVRLYQAICHGYPHVLGFELGKMFAPSGEIFDDQTLRGLLDIPELKGIKHSSLDRALELSRLRLRDLHRPDYAIYTGNDLGISMIEYGSDYLLGLATFAPERFAQRDRLWENGDAAYYALSDALQHLGNVAFRDPVPAYKHSAAVFLHLIGRIPSSQPHPKCPRRPQWEADILRDCAARLGYQV